ncbi:hypothetical protein [Mangrovimonas sp. ST2L15]|uniref:hypothetical protein n=1 Tax=Mangrovimonas sp. ST2L15 TaxID=1645916 RepID=UPI0006B46614|nr:hypothetical protein [Mangrovimonas sp. ST2L15]
MRKLFSILCIATTIFISSCSSDDSSSEEDITSDSNNLLVSQIVETYDDGTSATINFTYDGNKLVSASSPGYEEVYSYENNLLSQISEYEDGSLVGETSFEYDSQNRLINETYSSGGMQIQSNVFSYNEDGTITLDENGMNTYILTFLDGNLISEEDVNGDQDYSYTYDDKHSPFLNLHQRDVFELVGSFETHENNVLTYINTGGAAITDSYENTFSYNSDGYPITGATTFEPGTANEETILLQYIY